MISYPTRAEAISDLPTIRTFANGTVFYAGGMAYQVKSGSTAISDMNGVEPCGAATPDHFGTVTAASLNAMFSWAAAAGVNVEAYKTGSLSIAAAISIPSGVVVKGRLRLTTTASSGVNVVIGNNVTMDELEFICTANSAASHTMTIGTHFTAKSIYAEALVESNGTFCTIKNQGADVGRMYAFRWARPWSIDGSGSSVPASGGKFGHIGGSSFIRGLSVNFADGLDIASIAFVGRAAAASLQPGHNGVLQQGGSFNRYGRIYIDGAGEHAFRIGGSPDGSVNNDCTIGELDAVNTGGCTFKSNDSQRFSERWTVGRITERRNITPSSTNTEICRLNKTIGYRFGSINAVPTGSANSCSSGIQLNSTTDLVIDNLNIKGAASDIISLDDRLDEVNGPTSDIRIKSVTADGASRFMEIVQETFSIGNVSIENVYMVNIAEMVKRGTVAAFTGPITIEGQWPARVPNSGVQAIDPLHIDMRSLECGRFSNSNGEYVRYADGTQICIRRCDVNVGASTSQSFPCAANFATGSFVGVTVSYLTSTPNAALQLANLRAYGASAGGSSSFFLRLLNSGTSTAPNTPAEQVIMTATGRWF